MAPDIALQKIEELTSPGDVVLDPMCGSGTVPRLALEQDRQAIACDLDPLAVMMTRTACRTVLSSNLASRAEDMVNRAKRLRRSIPSWIEQDAATTEFVNYWFAEQQREQLGRLARVLADRPTTDDPLRLAMSRLIITKEGGASLARDTSHSRPHRVRDDNDFDVYAGFLREAERIEATVAGLANERSVSVRTVDARALKFVPRGSVTLIVTSPPYLNAIDYLRGHRMSLVWLGWRVDQLREVRGTSIGSERGMRNPPARVSELAEQAVPRLGELTPRNRHLVYRYADDIDRLMRSFARVTRPGGHLVLVVADSQLRGVPVSSSTTCALGAQRAGFALEEVTTRELPSKHRYLPPPLANSGAMASRMDTEVVLSFTRTA